MPKNNYPRSVLTGNIDQAFRTVYDFHRGRRRGDTLDPTCGERLWWGGAANVPREVVYSDIKPHIGDMQDLFLIKEQRPEWEGAFSMVVYDPPYMIDVARSKDPRVKEYGGYANTAANLMNYMDATETIFPWVLNRTGKIIVKCSDQYLVKERRLQLWHLGWLDKLEEAFNIVDLFVYPYHRVSSTAYQVKDRPSSIISHTYFIVGQKR